MDDGRDLRDEPIEERKAELARLLVDCQPALALNRVFDYQGLVIFEHACKFRPAPNVSGSLKLSRRRHFFRYSLNRQSNPTHLAFRS